jgi:hypothetical protein
MHFGPCLDERFDDAAAEAAARTNDDGFRAF